MKWPLTCTQEKISFDWKEMQESSFVVPMTENTVQPLIFNKTLKLIRTIANAPTNLSNPFDSDVYLIAEWRYWELYISRKCGSSSSFFIEQSINTWHSFIVVVETCSNLPEPLDECHKGRLRRHQAASYLCPAKKSDRVNHWCTDKLNVE